MREISDEWMAYIDAEVRAVCEKKRWGHQIRRKWSVRGKPVSESLVDDYEWKLIPGAATKLPEQPLSDFDEGTYYVLNFDPRGDKFVLQHDTAQCGMMGPHWDRRTYTEIHFTRVLTPVLSDYQYSELMQQVRGTEVEERLKRRPQDGWLRDHLIDLTSRFKPNQFSMT